MPKSKSKKKPVEVIENMEPTLSRADRKKTLSIEHVDLKIDAGRYRPTMSVRTEQEIIDAEIELWALLDYLGTGTRSDVEVRTPTMGSMRLAEFTRYELGRLYGRYEGVVWAMGKQWSNNWGDE